MSDAPIAAPAAPAAAPSAETSKAPVTDTSADLTAEDAEVEEAEVTKQEAKSAKKKFQLKVNNRMKDVELDLSNDEDIIKYLQKAEASDEKFQEAATLRKLNSL